MENLKELLAAECEYKMKSESMDRFLESMAELTLKANEPLIDYGALDSNIYIVKSGIVRSAYFNGYKEMTYAFGMAGTMLSSYFPFYLCEPSFFKYEACCESVFLKISKTRFLELTRQSHDFAQWVMWMAWGQLWLYEKKLQIVNGDAKERLESLIKNRPEIMDTVPMKYIATYIGVTPQYLSNLKQEILNESKKI